MAKDVPRQTFAKRLKQARMAAGISQRALGASLGLEKQVGSSRINRYEQSVMGCDIDTAGRLADLLEVPLSYLVESDEQIAELLLLARRMTKSQRGKLIALARQFSVAKKSTDSL